MFGHPTGVGCLLARKSALATLRRPWFAGGTITVASVQGDKYYLAEGAVRISVGMVTNFADVYRFMQFVESLLDQMSVQMMV
jgi:selenocysteine lyase/cysteine desulfurase